MKIGIQISSNLEKRTGVEEYVYQLLKHLPVIDDFLNHQFFLYNKENLKWPFKKGWTQIRLSLKMLRDKPDILFIPVHKPPFFAPKSVVTIQGLEYEAVPECYSAIERRRLRASTKRNIKKAEKIIVPSQNTKDDLINFYNVDPEKIFVIYHGVPDVEENIPKDRKYVLYLGSNHKRKNINGLKEAFKILREEYGVVHDLVLAGVDKYLGEQEKWSLLKGAEAFVFPSFYEGFGFPVLEAQKMGIPVIASDKSSLPEILQESALLVNPYNPEDIAEAIYKVLSDEKLKDELVKRGRENVKRFSWQKCAEETLRILTQ